MICYQDEKMYGPPADGMTEKQLDDAIKELELEIYGKELPKDRLKSPSRLIYDVNNDRFMNYELN